MTPPQPRDVSLSCDCGYKVGPTSEGIARHAMGRHSCERYLLRAERTARAQARWDGVDRTPRTCLHPRADHQHGTRATYVLDGCRCSPCSLAAVAFERKRVLNRAYGRPTTDLVDATETREHLQVLLASGMGRRRITELSGVNRNDINAIVRSVRGRPPRGRIRPATAAALLAVQVDPALGVLKDPTGTVRRLRGLVADGWTQTYLAACLGVTVSNFNSLILGRYPTVTRRTEEHVARLCAGLRPPAVPDRTALAVARRRGWVPSACWDEDVIEDPFAHPNWTGFDEALVQDWLAHCASPPGCGPEELLEVVRRLMAAEFTAVESASLSGLPLKEVQVLRDHITRQDRESGLRRRIKKERVA